MRDELLGYYERELTFLRQLGAEFADKYPKIASRLVLEADRCEDPHVERLIEGFAFLAARVHLKIDDDFPEITESLLSVLYPQYIRPVPSMSIVQFHVDPAQKITAGYPVARDTMLYSRPVKGAPLKFRTCYDTTIWPVTVSEAQWTVPERIKPPLHVPGVSAVCRLELACPPDVRFDQLKDFQSLRFYLGGEGSVIGALYELLLNNCVQVMLRDVVSEVRKPPVLLPSSAIHRLGFAEKEAVLPEVYRVFTGHRLLQEYFALPEKFFFLDLEGLERLAPFGSRAEVLFLISKFERAERQQTLEVGVSSDTFRLNCSPIVNLFPHTAEPILLEESLYEYMVVPDVRRANALEVYSIDDVVRSRPGSSEVVQYQPFYSFKHAHLREQQGKFWHAIRRPSVRKDDEGSDVWLSVIDASGELPHFGEDALTIRCTCTNRDLPSLLAFGNESGDFELEGGSVVNRIVALRRPTPTFRSPAGKEMLWRHISHLSLNYLSLVEEGKEALQEMLRLYNFADLPFVDRQISGITRLASRKHFARVISEHGIGFARGVRVEMELDEEQFVGGAVFLFASILEYYLGLYVTMNSFAQLVVTTRQRKEKLKEWEPRAGHQVLL